MKQSIVGFILIALALWATAQNQVTMTINQDAPVVQSNQLMIDAPPQTVWAVLTAIDNWSQWNERITNPTLSDTPTVGTTFTWKINGSKIKSKIHTFDVHRALGWTGKTFGASAIHNWYLEPTENGTIVRVEESREGWIISLMKKKMNQKLKEDMQHWLLMLKKECEK